MKQQSNHELLRGKRVVITRPKHQSKVLVDKIARYGGTPIPLPTIQLESPKEPGELERSLRSLEKYDWVLFTSVNGVEAVRNAMESYALSPDLLSSKKLGAIGPATAQALTDFVRAPDLMPDEYVSDAFAPILGDVTGLKFLLPRADIARKNLVEDLRKLGADVDDIAAYSIVSKPHPELVQRVTEMPESEKPDYFLVTSSSTVRGLVSLLEEAKKPHWIKEVMFASIGPITAKIVSEIGIEQQIVAKEYTVDGLVRELLEYENDK